MVGFSEARDEAAKHIINEEATKAIFEKAVNVSSFHKGGGHAFSLSFIKVRFVEAESPKISTIKITSNAKLISEYLGKESARVKATSFGRMAFIVAAASGRVLAEAMKNEAEDFEVLKNTRSLTKGQAREEVVAQAILGSTASSYLLMVDISTSICVTV